MSEHNNTTDSFDSNELINFTKELGGVENVWSVYANKVDDWRPPSGRAQPGPGAAPLSTAHISPQVFENVDFTGKNSTLSDNPFLEWVVGSSVLKVSKSDHSEVVGGGDRGMIKGFSYASRRRLMLEIGKVRRDAELPVFVTLTYPNNFPEPRQSKKHLDIFLKRLRRSFPSMGLIWKLEPQERGAPHYHMLVWGSNASELFYFVPSAWFDIAGGGDPLHLKFHLGLLHNEPCVNSVRSFRGVWSYASKYLGKTFDVAGWNNKFVGRFWGVINKENIPFGVKCVCEISKSQASHVMRYQRRFSKLSRKDFSSLTTFCDADQWVLKLVSEPNFKGKFLIGAEGEGSGSDE